MNILKKVLFFVFFGVSLHADSFKDLYTGTVTIEDGALVLYRCDAVKNRYVLVDSSGKKDSLVRKLPKEMGKQGYKVTVEVIGEYDLRDDKNYLIVERFGDITPNQSCHLLDFLDGIK